MVFQRIIQRIAQSFSTNRRRPKRRATRGESQNTKVAAELFEPRTLLSTVDATADTILMVHGQQADGDVLANDTYPASNFTISATSVSLVVITGTATGNGSLMFEDNAEASNVGNYMYFPPVGVFTGTATFSYTITDNDTSLSSTAAVTITITNDAPIIADANEAENGIANDDAITNGILSGDVGQADPIEIPIASILSHFADPNSVDQLELVIDGTLYGNTVFSSSNPGMIEYTPPVSGFVGGDPFDEIGFKVKDGGGLHSNRLRFFPRGSGTVNGQGIYLVDRNVGYPIGNHSAIMIVPTDQATWAADPRFSRVTKAGLHYATLSAYPNDFNVAVILSGNAELVSTINWADDEWKKLRLIEQLNVGGNENAMIQSLFALDAAFDDGVLTYDPTPAATDDEYNSNSYAHGLLNAAGITPGVAPGWHPGWEKPLPADEFVAD